VAKDRAISFFAMGSANSRSSTDLGRKNQGPGPITACILSRGNLACQRFLIRPETDVGEVIPLEVVQARRRREQSQKRPATRAGRVIMGHF
jgi:hypothetical protein